MFNLVKYLPILGLLGLGACETTQANLIETQFKVAVPPAVMYDCKVAKRPADPQTLTDIEVGKYIVHLYHNNVKCKQSIDAIKDFETKASQDVGK
jgi:hypothetical protein